jgi:fibro-slime domain-containing protein
VQSIKRITILFLMLVGCSGNPSLSQVTDHPGLSSAGANAGDQPTGEIGATSGGGNGPVLALVPPSMGGEDSDDVATGGASEGGAPSMEGCKPILTGTIRDFLQYNLPTDMIPKGYAVHPDFENANFPEQGIVAMEIGPDSKPVYNVSDANLPSSSTHGKVAFDQWYHDAPGVNKSIPITLELKDMGNGTYSYDNQEFFPIDKDDRGFGLSWDAGANALINHDFHFTLELHTRFTYNGGETFDFVGDDDVWVFINGKRAIDLGGVHGAAPQSVNLDTAAEMLGIKKGEDYALDFFSAERHLYASTIKITTTLRICIPPPTHTEDPPVIVK